MDDVFRALADPNRRRLLDELFAHDGQSLGSLVQHLTMTRFGVMKHLAILEEAGLITTRKAGRTKHHYLNPIPIHLVYDRWVAKYSRPITRHLTSLKHTVESKETALVMTESTTHQYQIFIKSTPEGVWQALIDPAWTERYYFGTKVESTWEVDAPIVYRQGSGGVALDGKVLEIESPRKLVTTFRAPWLSGESRVTFLLEADGEGTKVTVIHEGLSQDDAPGVIDGWARILSGLKTLLETGEVYQPSGISDGS